MKSRVVRGAGSRWPEIPVRAYKEMPEAYRDVTRRVLLGAGEGEEALAFELRYFEVAAGGFSSLERHEHPHAVVILAGKGEVRLGERRFEIEPFDAVYVAPGEPHQFLASRGEPLGFLCLVDRVRDRPELLGGG